MDQQVSSARLSQALSARTATVAVCGLCYVGLPLAATICRAGFPVVGFDIDADKVSAINAGRSYIGAVRAARGQGGRPRSLCACAAAHARIR
jgi:UDP-N-acetyl-D-mannosaminuronate dehydrogenase